MSQPRPIPMKYRAFETLKRALERATSRPLIGLTQGGSSRKFAGCKSACSDGLYRPPTRRK